MKRAEPGWLVLALAGIAALIASFLPFYTFGSDVELTVWSRSLFPTATLIPLFLFGIGLEALFVLARGYEPRSPFLNFTWSQARLAGSAFAILLALSFLVQGRAGGSLGTGYLIMSLSTLASFGGAVMTRRAEIARGHEEIVTAAHPWRAAILRWRRELTQKVQALATGGNPGPPSLQRAPNVEDAVEKTDDKKDVEPPEQRAETPEELAKEPEEPAPERTPLPRLSAVQSEPATEENPAVAAAARKAAPRKAAPRKPRPRKPAKRAAKKVVEETSADTVADDAAVNEGDAAAETEVEPAAQSAAPSDDEERERPAAPG